MQFYYIRHAQSENNALYDANRSENGRSEDPELTATGLRQAECLAEYISSNNKKWNGPTTDRLNLNGFALTHLYSSPMVRAVSTASAIAERTGLPVHAWEEVYESGGIYLQDPESGEHNGLPGKDRKYFTERFPNFVLPGEGWEEGWYNRPFEEYEARDERARRFLEQLLRKHGNTDDRVAVISHAGFYNHLMSVMLGVTQAEGWWFSIYNTAITRIDFENRRAVLAYTNRVTHLQPDLVT